MSSQILSYAQRREAQPPQTTFADPCSSCHQPAGNSAAVAQMVAEDSGGSWLEGLDFAGSGAELDGLDLFNIDYDTGVQADGNRVGTKVEASLARTNDGAGEGVEGAAGKLGAEVTVGTDGATLGFGATAVEGAYDARSFDAERVDGPEIRGGAGSGMGMGVRAHWGDSDGDGLMECGSGVDAGPLSADVQSKAFCPLNGPSALLEWWSQE